MTSLPVLFYTKYKLGKSIGSPSLVVESKRNLGLFAALGRPALLDLSFTTSGRSGGFYAVAALGIAGFMIKEGVRDVERRVGEIGTKQTNDK